MKTYDVIFIHPITGREVTALDVSSDQLHQNHSGEQVYRFNSIYDQCEVVGCRMVTEAYKKGITAYMNQYGSASE